jgi:DNA processing protein
MFNNEKPFWVCVTGIPGIGPKSFFALLDFFGSAGLAWRASTAQLVEAGLTEKVASLIVRRRKTIHPEEHLETLEKQGYMPVCQFEETFPARLKEVDRCPPVLFVRGSLASLTMSSIAVVGTRKPSHYGRSATESLVRELASYNFTIVSGLARGIDGIAHRTALDSNVPTIAFLGGGIDTLYPVEHTALAHEIVRNGGALVSEFPPGYVANKGTFPARNRLISGISLGVVVVEGMSSSGTVHTANHAKKQGRPLFAVPGPITSPLSDAPMNLLTVGDAIMVRNAEDIVHHLVEQGMIEKNAMKATDGLQGPTLKVQFVDDVEELIYLILEIEPMESDDLIRKSTLPPSQVLTTLTMMELKGMVRKLGATYEIVKR